MIVSGRGKEEDVDANFDSSIFWEVIIPHCSRSCRAPIAGFVNRTCTSLMGVPIPCC